jgi:thioredoxin-like negative regulator of GroEL
MESLLAHVAHKERGRLRVRRVDADRQRRLGQKLRVEDVPSLLLVVGGKVVGRIDGRANLPQIERLLAANLGEQAPV